MRDNMRYALKKAQSGLTKAQLSKPPTPPTPPPNPGVMNQPSGDASGSNVNIEVDAGGDPNAMIAQGMGSQEESGDIKQIPIFNPDGSLKSVQEISTKEIDDKLVQANKQAQSQNMGGGSSMEEVLDRLRKPSGKSKGKGKGSSGDMMV